MARRKQTVKPLKQVLIVELGADTLKLLVATSAGKGIDLERVHVESLAPDGHADEALAAALKRHKIKCPTAIGALPRQSVNLRILELPSTDDAEIADMIELQAGRQTPYSRDEILSDYKLLGQARRGTYTRVLLAIVQRSIVRERFHDIEHGGLEIARMSVSTEGLLTWVESLGLTETKAVAVLDIDASASDLIVVHQDNLVSSKHIMTGAAALREGGDAAAAKFADDVKRAIEASREGGVEVGSLVATGAAAAIPGLEAVLARDLGVEVSLRGAAAGGVRDKHGFCAAAAEAGISVTALVGMALAPGALDMNLCPDVVCMRRELVTRSRELSAMGIAAMAVLVCGSLWLTLAGAFKAVELAKVEAEMAATQPGVTRVEKMTEVVREVHVRRDPRSSPIAVMPELHRCIPAEVFLESMEYDVAKRTLVLGGTAPSRKEVRTLVATLAESPLFEQAEESGKNAVGKDGRFVFQVSCRTEDAK